MNVPDPVAQNAGTPILQDPVVTRRLLSAIVEGSNDAILSKDLDGIITSWNRGAELLYGYTAAEAVGRPVSILVPPEIDNELPLLMSRLRQGEQINHYETLRMARDGRRIQVSLTISPLRDDTGRIFGASTIARNISDRRVEESRWRTLSDLGQVLTEILDPEMLLRAVADLLVRDISDYCITYLFDGNEIRRVGAAHADVTQSELLHRLIELSPPRLDDVYGAGAVIRTGEPILVAEIPAGFLERAAGGGEYLHILKALDPVSTIVLPLRARGRIVGALALVTTSRTGRQYGETDLMLGQQIADRIGLALDNARLYGRVRAELAGRHAAEESLRSRYGQLRVLYEMTEAVARAERLEEIYDRALEGLRKGLGVERASILLFDPDGVMRFKAWRGLSDGYRQAVEGHSPWSIDAKDPLPITIPDVGADVDLDDDLRATILGEGIRAMGFIPLVFGGSLLGKFMLYFNEPREFGGDEVELARTVASTIAFAIRRLKDETSVREAKETAERANAAKSQFLGIMSHELRTPLNAVLGYAELLLLEIKGGINQDQRQQLERIRVSARHQLELVDELLAYTRLEAGREAPRLMETDARRVIKDVVELVRPESDAKGLDLRADLPDHPLPLVTDPAKLRQIVLNLAGNAAKYTDGGEVRICARQGGEHLVVEVSDTGPGIPTDKLDYIFEPFARVDETLSRKTSGTGLGLAIARRLTDLLDGQLEVTSVLGEGSTFTLTLPLDR